MIRIEAVSTAFPRNYYAQADLTAALMSLWSDAPVDAATIARIHERTGVDGRHLALPLDQYRAGVPWGERNRQWQRAATDLGTQAARGALASAGLPAESIDALVFVTVTGIATPSIDALIVNRLGLPSRVRRMPIFGLGCVAGAAGLARAADLLAASPGGVALLVSTELCSLTFQYEDLAMANVIATGLFGDGAAAVVLVDGARAPGPGPARPRPGIVATRSVFYPATERIMGWDLSEAGFRLVLSPELPDLIRARLAGDVDGFLRDQGLDRSAIRDWIVHTGGPKVFSAIEETLGLPADALDATKRVLAKFGNLSSASVLTVLGDVMASSPPPGSYGLILAMGPGFCTEMVLVRWSTSS